MKDKLETKIWTMASRVRCCDALGISPNTELVLRDITE